VKNYKKLATFGKSIIQGGSNMTGTVLYTVYAQSVPVIFEPPCSSICFGFLYLPGC